MNIAITNRCCNINNKNLYMISKNLIDILSNFNANIIPIYDLNNINDIVKKCDALILTGSPIHINKESSPILDESKYEQKEDLMDFHLIQYFYKNKKPILGICRGMQILNVFFGGTLKPLNKHDNTPHNIHITENSFLKNIYLNEIKMVNSSHKECIDFLSEKFKVSAISTDNSIEAIEFNNIIGVQWHPEHLLDFEFFKYFLKQIK